MLWGTLQQNQKFNDFEIVSDEELSETNGGMSIWQGIDGVLSSFQSTPSWVQKKVAQVGMFLIFLVVVHGLVVLV